MEKTGRFKIVTITGGRNIVVDEDKRQRIARFRGIIGKVSEDLVSWAIEEAEEL